MKTVTLFRHAKSGEKGNPRIRDFDRPLSDRGLKAAPKMGVAMREPHLRPTLILCSPSVRTLPDADAWPRPEAWDKPPKVRFDERLYEASAQTILEVLKKFRTSGPLLIVGHNPGMQDFSVMLSANGRERQRLKDKLPTASVVTLSSTRALEGFATGDRPCRAVHVAENASAIGPRTKAVITIIDNYDSFTYNLVHYFGDLGVDVRVYRNDEKTAAAVLEEKPEAIVMSPGPCTPNEAGICLDLAKKNKGRIHCLACAWATRLSGNFRRTCDSRADPDAWQALENPPRGNEPLPGVAERLRGDALPFADC